MSEVKKFNIANSVVDLIKIYVDSTETNSKMYIKLKPEVINVVKRIVSYAPDSLNEIETAILEIIKDEKIDYKDIPNFIIIIKKLCELIFSLATINLNPVKIADIAANILKFIINILVIEGKIKISEGNLEVFYKLIHNLIDSCMDLLSFSQTVKIKGCFSSCFK